MRVKFGIGIMGCIMNDPLQPYYDTIEEMKTKGLYTPMRVLQSPQGPWITIDGKKLLNFCSNNYLGFAQDKRIVKAVIKAVVGVSSAVISGNLTLHMKARKRWLDLKDRSSIFAGRVYYCMFLNYWQKTLFSDELNHARHRCDQTEVKNKFIYKHSDMAELELRLIAPTRHAR